MLVEIKLSLGNRGCLFVGIEDTHWYRGCLFFVIEDTHWYRGCLFVEDTRSFVWRMPFCWKIGQSVFGIEDACWLV